MKIQVFVHVSLAREILESNEIFYVEWFENFLSSELLDFGRVKIVFISLKLLTKQRPASTKKKPRDLCDKI